MVLFWPESEATSGAGPCGSGTTPEAKMTALAATTMQAKLSERQKTAEFQSPCEKEGAFGHRRKVAPRSA